MKRIGVDVIPLVVFLLFFVLLFRCVLFGGRFMLIGDPLKQLYPLRMVAWDMIRGGKLPLWTPYVLSGYPLLSMVMLGIGYPVTWGYLFMPGHWAEQLYVLAPYLLAPAFTYAYLRESGRSPVASMLGGLAFGYGGFLFSPIGLTGVHANSALWMPLLLLGIQRARRKSFLSPLLLSTAAYTMSILAGSGQIFLYAGSLALAYGGFLALIHNETDGEPARSRWQPLAVAAGSILLSAGLTAFQSLETWNAVGLSSRSAYPFSRFSEGSFPLQLAVRSLIQPAGNFWDSSTFTPLLALVLAIVAVLAAARRPRLYNEVFFWLVVAVVAWLLILGKNTPVFKLYSYVPLVGRFRYPSRHSMEWTFAIAVLAAFGWDIVESWFRGLPGRSGSRSIVTNGSWFVLIAGLVASEWGRIVVARGLGVIGDLNNSITQLNGSYLGWKAAFTLSIGVALCIFCRLSNVTIRTAILAVIVAFYCFVEPFFWIVRPLEPWTVSAAQFGSFGEATRVLQKVLGERERNYSVVNPYAVSLAPVRDIDAVNWTALAHIRDINGYESLILHRYISALCGLAGESLDTEPFVSPNPALFDPKSHVLDLLNVRFVTAYTDLSSNPVGRSAKDGIMFSDGELGVDLKNDATFSLSGGGSEGDTLALVTAMSVSGKVVHGTPVARLTIRDVDGHIVERYLRAGIDTSEWAYDRADVKASILHGRAPIFDTGQFEPQGHFHGHRFLGRIDLGERLHVDRIDIIKIAATGNIGLGKASLYDSVTGHSTPLPLLSPARWQTVHDKNGVVIVRNLRALPPAWLATNVEAAEKTEILYRILGTSDVAFDPVSTALVEMNPSEVPRLSGAPLSADSHVRITTYEPSRIVAQTASSQQTMLILSEIYYPGWIATVDGVQAPIRQTDYLLRGLFVPAGNHTIEMVYTAPGARKGGVISLASAMLLGMMIVFRRRLQSTQRHGVHTEDHRA